MTTSTNLSDGISTTSPLFLITPQCTKEAKFPCEYVNGSSKTCFGANLAHDSVSFELVTDASNSEEAQQKLLLWSGLRAVPRCWDVIQPLLCSVYYPNCEDSKITLPDRGLCLATRRPCQIVESEYGWPDFLNCQNNDVFREGCAQHTVSLKFNKSDCESPLIATNNSESFYDEVEGCGLQCMNPLFNQEEHDDIHTFIAIWTSVTCICTFFAMCSFFIDWKNASKYPARIIFYINSCFFVAGLGWIAQFLPRARDDIVCRRDGTVRLREPVGTGESPSCVIVFVMVYYFLMAGIVWFDILAYSWYLMFKALGTYKDPLIGKAKTFHAISWSVPCILLLACLGVSEIDGDSMSGICFIGYKNHVYRLGFLLIPVGIVLLVGGFFLVRGLCTLFSIKKGHPGFLSDSALSKINWSMIRIGIFTALAFAFVFVSFAVHVYDYTNQALWEKSFRDYIKCEANVTILEKLKGSPPQECILEHHPNLSVLKLNLIALFGTGIVMSTWVWTKASAANWKRAWFRLIGRGGDETKRITQKSRVIAKAFANRNILKRFGKKEHVEDSKGIAELEYTEHTMSHEDPLGMDFDLHSVSQEMSSTWIRNVPKIVERRGGILPEGKSSARSSRDAPKRTRIREKAVGVEPGLWAVSQYIDGSNMKTKSSTKPRKVAPLRAKNNMFIGSSPYDLPSRPRRLSPVVYYDGQLQPISPCACSCGLYERFPRHDAINTNILPGTSQRDSKLEGCIHPGYVTNDEAMTSCGQCEPSFLRVTECPSCCESSWEDSQHSLNVSRSCAFYNSNNKGNRLQYNLPMNASVDVESYRRVRKQTENVFASGRGCAEREAEATSK